MAVVPSTHEMERIRAIPSPHLLLVRHGTAGLLGGLTKDGLHSMALLASRICSEIVSLPKDERDVAVYCSLAPRARQSAEVVAERLGVPVRRTFALGDTQGCCTLRGRDIFDYLGRISPYTPFQPAVAVLVTHGPVIAELSDLMMEVQVRSADNRAIPIPFESQAILVNRQDGVTVWV